MVSTTYQLTMHSGPTPGKVFPLEKDELLIGRDMSSDIVVNDAGVSRRHAHLVVQDNGYVLEDLGSTNGTFVSGQRLVGPYRLHSGESFTLGESITLVYEEMTYDPDATIASPRAGVMPPVSMPVTPPIQAAPQMQAPPPMQPVQQPRPVASPPPVYSAPVSPQPSYAGQVPAGPAPAPVKKKGGFPVWLIIILVIIVLLICVCVVGGVIIDQTNSWCKILPFIPGCQ
jgi:predicted component of type VI protein secretion system